jgi:hypothetical protein
MNNNRYTLVCGPSDAIKKRALIYSILMPGGNDPMNVAKKIKAEFVKIAGTNHNGLLDFIKSIIVDDIIRTIPPGQSKISFTERGDSKGALGLATTLVS